MYIFIYGCQITAPALGYRGDAAAREGCLYIYDFKFIYLFIYLFI